MEIRYLQVRPLFFLDSSPLMTPVPLETKKFGPSEIFTERSSPRSNAAWEALAGRTMISFLFFSGTIRAANSRIAANHENPGFIYVPNWEELKLPPGGVIHGEMMYGISMFHQLHCLVCGSDRHSFYSEWGI